MASDVVLGDTIVPMSFSTSKNSQQAFD